MTRPPLAGTTPLGLNSEQQRPNARGLYRDLQIVIAYVPTASIKTYDRHARKHSKKQIAQIAASFEAFGVVSPLVIDAAGQLIAGHGRLAAAKLLGYDTVPVVRVDHLDDAHKRALRIADNQLATLAEWDEGLLALEFADLLKLDLAFDLSFDLGITGFAAAEIDRLVSNATEEDGRPDDEVPEPDLKNPPVSRVGDLWILGEHRILCGDSRDAASYRTLLGDERAAMSINDAPYNLQIAGMVSKSGKHAEFCMGVGELTPAQFTAFLTSFLTHLRAFAVPGAVHFAFMDWRHLGEMLGAGEGAGLALKNLCVWHKDSAGMGATYRSQHELCFMFVDPGAPHKNRVELGAHDRNRTNVWEFPGAAGLRKELELHPTPKPVSMIAEAIRDVSDRNDIVLDSFSGSGTTILAAARTGRRARVIELDPHYVDVAIRRWQDWSGLTAVHATTGVSFATTIEQRSGSALVDAGSPSNLPRSPEVRVRRRPPAGANA